jgi:excinuclease ABC subunit C
MSKDKQISSILEKIPHLPGVYKFLDENQNVIYVGKAKDLKNRVSNYFNKSGDDRIHLPALLARIKDIEYIVVDNEIEALFLETNLIKKLKPKYNILMKDDKNFVYIKITTQKNFPKIFITRKIKKDKATYIGPYTSARDIRKTFKLIKDLLPYPHCELNIQKSKQGKFPEKPLCIFKEIDEAHSPCICDLDKSDYQQLIQSIINFLKGKHDDLFQKIKANMLQAAEDKKFERAAKLRDRMMLLEKILEKQKITSTNLNEDLDIIDIIHINNKYLCSIFLIRSGKVINNQNIVLSDNQIPGQTTTNLKQAFQSFIQLFYSDNPNPPKEIIIPEPVEDQALLEEYLSQIHGHKIKIHIPARGRKRKLLTLATKNVENFAKQMKVKWLSEEARSYQKVAEELKELLNLPKLPKRLECYDISHLQGTHTVASMVVFDKGEPLKSNYRIFNIKSLQKGEINDFQSMEEVLNRRLKYLSQIPKGFKASNKQNQYTLKDQNKEIAVQVTYQKEDSDILIQSINYNPDLKHLVIPTLIKLCKKFKQRKLLSDQKDLIEFNFQAIKNNKHPYGFYISKLKPDPSFSQQPDLIIIDGGKGQLSSALKAKHKLKVKIPFISLAKRQETIFKEDKEAIQLPDNSPTRLLIQQLRDEAHRFAITHNRKRRQKIKA